MSALLFALKAIGDPDNNVLPDPQRTKKRAIDPSEYQRKYQQQYQGKCTSHE
jgi:hypothetical protein